jgi:hypothetical protein
MHYTEPKFTIYRVHPDGVRVEKADKTLKGKADKGALAWCGPFNFANGFGWWVYPGFDIDITCHENHVEGCHVGRNGGYFTYDVKSYDLADHALMKNFEDQVDNPHNLKYQGKQHYAIDEPEKNCISLWTGLFAQMPKDWSLMIKSPTNIGLVYDKGCPVCVQEGILELDWMRYDLWMNFKFHTFNTTLSFRKDQDWPIAQLIPIHRSSYETQWELNDLIMDANNPDCVDAYQEYAQYNYEKWYASGEKDPFTFRKKKKEESLKCPMQSLFKK